MIFLLINFLQSEARRIVSEKIKKNQYSQDVSQIRSNVSQVVKLCQLSVDFAWKEMFATPTDASSNNGALPEDHPIIRVERRFEYPQYLYIYLRNVRSPCLDPCLRNKTNFANLPRGVRYLIGTVSEKKFIHEKKFRFASAPAARENVLRSQYKLPQNGFLEIWTIEIS